MSLPPLPRPLRQLLAFVADYYLAPPAAVLRMALPQAAFVAAPRAAPLFALGEIPETKHAGRRAMLERLEAVRDLTVAPLAVWAAAAEAKVEALRALVRMRRMASSSAPPSSSSSRPLLMAPTGEMMS